VLVHRSWVGGAITTDPNPIPVTRVRDLTIDSPGVGTVKVRLLLPSRFDAQPSTRWPVLYLLDGCPSLYSDWSEFTDINAPTAPTDLLVVMPDAGACGFYSDWWNGGKGGPPKWETFHLVELRQLLERNWQAGDRRAIEGYSTGGFGAFEYATRNPRMSLLAESFSGVFDVLGHLDRFGDLPPDRWGDPVKQVDIWKAHDALMNAEALRGTALFVAYGNGQLGPLDNGPAPSWDPTGDTERANGLDSAAFVERLGELKIPVTVYAYGNGTHTFPYMERDLHQSIPLILKALGETP
jgi:diacylglycerol O-acyltransferase / trehalose O-mycolyltransferase